MTCNDLPAPIKSLKIRGKTSLYYPKKSFTLKLDDKIDLPSARGTVRLEDCCLLGLSMDQCYVHNYIAFAMMDVLGLFNLAFGYCEVIINGETQGIYLFVERPRDYALKSVGSPAIIRRGFDEKIDDIEIGKNSPSRTRRSQCRKFDKIYAHCRKYRGQALYDSLDAQMDMTQYMNWLAFNFLIRNGDYTDEIHLYVDPKDDRFRIIPWDYDDIFSTEPHEGRETRRSVPGGGFIYSSEDRLDRMIITDEYLYARYLEQLLEVTGTLNDATLKRLFRDAYCAVYPYYLKGGILETTGWDKFGSANLGVLRHTLRSMLKQFLIIRNSVLSELTAETDPRSLPYLPQGLQAMSGGNPCTEATAPLPLRRGRNRK
jgi:spore coat protein H